MRKRESITFAEESFDDDPVAEHERRKQEFNHRLEQCRNLDKGFQSDIAWIEQTFGDDEEVAALYLSIYVRAAHESAQREQAFLRRHYGEYLGGKPPWHLRALKDVTTRHKGLQPFLEFLWEVNRTSRARRRYYHTELTTVAQIKKFNAEEFDVTKLHSGKWPLSLVLIDGNFYDRAAEECGCSKMTLYRMRTRLHRAGVLVPVCDVVVPRRGRRLTVDADGYFVDFRGKPRKQTFFVKQRAKAFAAAFE